MTDAPQFVVASKGREVGILNQKKKEIAIFHGGTAQELKRRLEWAERGLNDGSISTRDWVWEDYNNGEA